MKLSQTILILALAVSLSACGIFSKNKRDTNKEQAAEEAAIPANSNFHLLDYVENELDSNRYYELVDSVSRGLSNDYFELRMAYTKTKYYNPYSIARNMFNDTLGAMFDSKRYDDLIRMTELRNNKFNFFVDPVYHFYKCLAYMEKGDTIQFQIHRDIYHGLIRSLELFADGKNAETAFIVIAVYEEYIYMNYNDLNVASQSLVYEYGHKFDILHYSGEESDERKKMYFNIDLPFMSMSKSFEKALNDEDSEEESEAEE